MMSSPVLCVLLGVVLSVRAASVAPTVEDLTSPVTVTEPYNDTTTTTTPQPTTQLITPTCCMTTPTSATPTTTPTTPYSTTTPTTTPTTPYSTTTPTTTPTTPYSTTTPTTTPTTPYSTTTPTTTPTTPYSTTTPTTTPTTPYSTTTPTTTPTTPYSTTTPTTTPTTPYSTPPTKTPNPTTPSSQSRDMCPDGWEVFQGRCYHFVNEPMSWPQAQSNCAMLDSMLVSVHSIQEYGFLQQLTYNNVNQQAWLGGFYLQDQWLWLDGSWFYNNTWSSESPDSSNPCLTLNSNEAWSNSPCTVAGYSSICVKNSNVPSFMLCPDGWTGFQGRCFYPNQEPLTWPEADANCARLDASLVSVHSLQEYSFLYQQSIANGFSSNWLGGFYVEDQWMWLDGSWFYQGFFSQTNAPETSFSCLATFYNDGWTNSLCQQQTLPSFCVKNMVV